MQLHIKFIETAKKYPKKTAVNCQATKIEFSYERLLIASFLMAKSFSKIRSQYVGIMVPTSAGCVLAILGALMAGKTPVMINYSTGARDNAMYAQEKCSFKTIITSKKLLEKLDIEPVDGMIFMEDIKKHFKTTDKLKAAVKAKLPLNVLKNMVHHGSDDENATILFTSGSEKEPKAVQLTHKNIMHNVIAVPKVYDMTEKDIFLANLPLFHVFGLTVDFWLPVLLGCTIVTYPNPLDYKMICSLIKKYKATVMVGTPAFFYGYLKRSQPGDFDSVRFFVAGADKLNHQIYDGYLKKHNLKIYEGYGTTETSPVVSVNTPDFHKVGSIGRPIPGVKVRILDRETDEILPPNKTGKILVKGDLVMPGYLHDLEETSLRLHNGWYDTGDMGMLDDDGFLWHKGRLKRFVKIGGEMVSLVKVEDELNNLLEEEVICCVVDVPNPLKGADIVAAVTTGAIDKKKIMKLLSKKLPSIALPKEFYVIEDIPMMGSGKVNFREVEKICRSFQENGKKNRIH